MNKPRCPHSIDRALEIAMGILGAEGIAEIAEKSASMVYKWSNPDSDQNLPAFLLQKIDDACAKHGRRPFKEFLDFTASADEAAPEGGTLEGKMLGIMGAVGGVAEALDDALDPSSEGGSELTPNELHGFNNKIDETIAGLTRLKCRANPKPVAVNG